VSKRKYKHSRYEWEEDRPRLTLNGTAVLFTPPFWQVKPEEEVFYYVRPGLKPTPEILQALRMTAQRCNIRTRWPRPRYPEPVEVSSPLPKRPLKMFCDYSPWPCRVMYVDSGWHTIHIPLPPPLKYQYYLHDGPPTAEECLVKSAEVRLDKFEGEWPGQLYVEGWYGWEPITRTVVVAHLREMRIDR
jgi:hypothetical protein